MRVFTIVCASCLALLVGIGCAEEGGGGGQGGSGGPGAELEELERETEEEELEGEFEGEGPEGEFEEEAEPEEFEEEAPEGLGEGPEGGEAECHPSYEGACLDPNASDYDCEGGSGDGPLYTGPVTVVGPDEFDLDRDGDGTACESS